MQRRRQSGFTLVELMVTLAVLVILAMLAIPSYSDFYVKSRLRGATDDVVSLLNASRINSTKLQRQINVSINSSSWCAGAVVEDGPVAGSGAAMALANTPCACNCSATTDTCLVDSSEARVCSSAYSGVTVTSVTNDIKYTSSAPNGGGVTFNPKLGAVTDSSGNFPPPSTPCLVLAAGKYSTQITVSPLGQVLVCVPSTSTFIPGYPSCSSTC
jgi:type IV fimbrial biogenesis protein FimT